MSREHGRGYNQHGEAPEPLTWERVVFRQGDGRYVFEVEEGGLHAKLTSPHGTSLTLPMVAWEGLLDALMGARKARTRNERGFPARSGSRWYDGEAGELTAGFRAGRSITQLARAHNRSEHAIEAELDRLGLWDRMARRAIAPNERRQALERQDLERQDLEHRASQHQASQHQASQHQASQHRASQRPLGQPETGSAAGPPPAPHGAAQRDDRE